MPDKRIQDINIRDPFNLPSPWAWPGSGGQKSDPEAEALLNRKMAPMNKAQRKALLKKVYEIKALSGGKLTTQIVRRGYDEYLREHSIAPSIFKSSPKRKEPGFDPLG